MNATLREATAAASTAGIVSIVTHRIIAASSVRVWDSLRFYEEFDRQAPWLLRVLLPRPQRTVTAATAVGDQTRLPYVDGHYSKQVTRLERPYRYEFDVLEQQLPSDHGVLLLSGAYTLREISPTQTDLSITTRYLSGLRPRWLLTPFESFLCRRLQQHLLDEVQAKATQ